MKEVRGRGSVLLKKTGGKFGGYRFYSYICNCKSKLNQDFYDKAEEVVCEYRLFFLYVGDPEIFVIHGTHGGHGKA